MVDWNEVSAIAAAASVTAAVVTLLVQSWQQNKQIAGQVKEAVEQVRQNTKSLLTAHEYQVRALAGVQRREAYGSILSALFGISEWVRYHLHSSWVTAETNNIAEDIYQYGSPDTPANAGLQERAATVIVAITSAELDLGIGREKRSVATTPLGNTVDEVRMTLLKSAIDFETAVSELRRNQLDKFTQSLISARLAGAPLTVTSAAQDLRDIFESQAEKGKPMKLGSPDEIDFTRSRLKELDVLGGGMAKDLAKDLQPNLA